MRLRVGDECTHSVELVVAREDQFVFAPVVVVRDELDETVQNIEQGILRQHLFPQIRRLVLT